MRPYVSKGGKRRTPWPLAPKTKYTFGEKLQYLRSRRGWTQVDTSLKMRQGPKAYGGWERGESLPSLDQIEEILEVFEINYDELMRDVVMK